jgi:Bacterial SH3 domain
MPCPNCQLLNNQGDFFCLGCGNSLIDASQSSVFPNTPQNQSPFSVRNPQVLPVKSNLTRNLLFAAGGSLFVILLGVGLFFGIAFINKKPLLPNHLGFFVRKDGGLEELRKIESKDFLSEKSDLFNQDSIADVSAKPAIIVYSDTIIPVDKLKLVALDSIKDDGSFQFIDYQLSPVEGQTEMKELRVPENLADGKYAYVVFDGYLNDGNHKFWVFQVSDNQSKETASFQNASVELKPVSTPQSTVSPAAEASSGFCNNRNVLLRSSPSLLANPIGKIQSGQRVNVVQTSSNYDYWHGIRSNWAYIKTPDGRSGWMFHHFVTYQ